MQISKKELEALQEEAPVLLDEPMKKHTTFRTGGPADYYFLPQTTEGVVSSVLFCREKGLPYFIIGNGSNLLVSDEGYRGAVIEIGGPLGRIRNEGESLYAQAGVRLAVLASFACEASLEGLEFASGIPGTLGGAVCMNAGAYGGEMSRIVRSVRALARDGKVITYSQNELAFGYRKSLLQTRGDIVLEAELVLKKGDKAAIRQRMKDLSEKRRQKQPLNFPSAGSTFKRPEGYFAGKLIEDAGLSGYRIGGAAVSEKHCGFLVNKDNATSADIHQLIRHVTEKVFEYSGIRLEPEIRFLGEF